MTPTLAVSSHALRRATRHDRRTRAWWPPPCLRAAALLAQDAFRRFDARSRDRERPVHDPLTFTEPQPRTLSPDTDMPFLSPKDRRVALPALRHDPTFRSRPLRNGKMLLTDFCNPLKTRAPTDRSTPERTPLDVLTDERA